MNILIEEELTSLKDKMELIQHFTNLMEFIEKKRKIKIVELDSCGEYNGFENPTGHGKPFLYEGLEIGILNVNQFGLDYCLFSDRECEKKGTIPFDKAENFQLDELKQIYWNFQSTFLNEIQ